MCNDPVAISIRNLGKRYRLYRSPAEKLADVMGLHRLMPWRKKAYPHFWALRGLDLEVRKGERIGLIGRNGAGKSTLLKIVCGLIAPTEGTVQVAGRVQALMELGTGFHPEFTGRQNIRASLTYQNLSQAEITRAEAEIIDFSELEEFIDRPIKTYSAGMHARLAFATSTYLRPEILIIDEILGAGDAYFAGKCLERMRRITEEAGATVLFVSHDLASVHRLCNRVIWVERGRIKMQGDPLDCIKAYSDQVRREEDLRVTAKEMRLHKAHTAALKARHAVYVPMLFHLVTDGPHPRRVHRVKTIRLWAGAQEVGTIDVGAMPDPAAERLHHVIDGPGMDWSLPTQHRGGWVRSFRDCGGHFRHAPFQFLVPKTLATQVRDYAVEVDGDLDPREPVYLERHVDGRYERVGPLTAGQRLTFTADGPVGKAEVRPTSLDEYGNKTVVLRGVQFLDAAGRAKTVFTTGEKVVVELAYEAFEAVADPAFVFAVYLDDGQCAAQVWATASELGRPTVAGPGKVRFVIDRLTLGPSAYVASAAVFAEFRQDNVEPTAYHVLDRCIHFQVAAAAAGPWAEPGLAPQEYQTEMVA